MSESKDHASALWDRAEECRALANIATDKRLRADYRKLADAYLKLAAEEEKLAKRAKKAAGVGAPTRRRHPG